MLTSSALYDALLTDLTPVLHSSAEHQMVAAEALKSSLFKKFEDEGGEAADAAAIEKFISVNQRCGQFKFEAMHEWEWMALNEVKALLERFFIPTSVGTILSSADKLWEECSAGPGSSIGARGEDFFTKHFDSTLTYTHRSGHLLWLYSRGVALSPTWSGGEILRQSRHGFKVVEGSRLSCVPKNATISRTICTEPSLNMFFQLGTGRLIENRLRSYGIDLAKQPDLNRELARLGSLNGSFGTIDLSSASDSLSNKMLEWVLPEGIFRHLFNLRSDKTQLPNGDWLELQMLSTMGNGYTFPLQTTLFACVVIAVYKCLGLRVSKNVDGVGDTYGVFGDDIIVRREAYDFTCRVLSLLGFVVNSEKSFNEGAFRESCGADWYRGYDVRGVYCKTLVDVGSRFSLANRLIAWSSRHGINLHNCVGLLLRELPVCKVPFLDMEDAGLRVPASESGIPNVLVKAVVKYLRYEQLKPRLKYDAEGDFGPPKGKLKRRYTNQYGIVIAMLQGSAGLGTIALRASGEAKYRACRTRCHYWDALTRVVIVNETTTRDAGPIKVISVPAFVPGGWMVWQHTVRSHLEKVRRGT